MDMGTGMLIGSGLNYGAGKSAQNASHKSVQNAIDTLKGTERYAEDMKSNGERVLQDMINGTQSLYGTPEQAAAELAAARQGIDSVNPYTAGNFDYSKEISDFYDPAFQLSVNTANDAINSSQALGGNLFSSDTADKIAGQNQVLASKMYRDALDAMNSDKNFELNRWQSEESARRAEAEAKANLAKAKYDIASGNAGNISNAQNAYYQALLGLNNDYYTNKTDYASALASLEASDPGKSRGVFGDIASIFGF